METTLNKKSIVDDAPLSAFHKKLTLYTTGGPILDGYILSMIGVALIQLTPQMHLDTFWSAVLGASTLVGLFIGGFGFGYLTDKLGRHRMYTVDLGAMMIFSIAQVFCTNAVELVIVRFLLGVFVGADYPIATSLLAEFAPAKHRGILLGILQASWFLGAWIAYVVGYALLNVGPNGWKWMLASSAILAFIVLCMRLGTPESPRWLLNKGRRDEALAVLKQVYGPEASTEDLKQLEQDPGVEKVSFGTLFKGEYFKRTMYVGLFWTICIIPSFAIYTFGPALMEALNIHSKNTAFILESVTSLMFVIGDIPAILLINKMGRRPMVIWSFVIMAIGLLILGIFPNSVTMVFIGFAIYAVFSGGPSILTWIYPNELFPTEIRASAVGVGTSFSRIGSFIGTFFVPYALSGLGISKTMIWGAILTFIGALISIAWAPETKGKSLDEASRVTEAIQA